MVSVCIDPRCLLKQGRIRVFATSIFACLCVLFAGLVNAQQQDVPSYLINAGDILSLDVWNEETLSEEQILVRPDGYLSVPVIGEVRAGGQTVAQLEASIIEGLSRYLKDSPTVVISVLQSGGSSIFVLGKVNRPGGYPLSGPMDVTQALALAGGLNNFAAENKIRVLRRDAKGVQTSIKFKYGEVKDGDKLESNILLKSGDLILVP